MTSPSPTSALDLAVELDEPAALIAELGRVAEIYAARGLLDVLNSNRSKGWAIVHKHALSAAAELEALNAAPERPAAAA